MNPKFFVLWVSAMAKRIPKPIRSFLLRIKANRILDLLKNKYTAELAFQKVWAAEFPHNIELVREYWKTYRFLDTIHSTCMFTEKTKVLDVGCGISTVLNFVDGIRVGIDPLANEYKKYYQYPRDLRILKAFSEHIPFNDNYFDVVFCTNVLDHVTSPAATIREIHRVLKSGGCFVLTVEVFPEKITRDHAHPHSLESKDLERLLGEQFIRVFDRESSWIGMRNYIHGERTSRGTERILILKKQ